jgi:hypothetical protein
MDIEKYRDHLTKLSNNKPESVTVTFDVLVIIYFIDGSHDKIIITSDETGDKSISIKNLEYKEIGLWDKTPFQFEYFIPKSPEDEFQKNVSESKKILPYELVPVVKSIISGIPSFINDLNFNIEE